MPRFQPFRENGQSDADLVFEMVKDASPDDIFQYESLQEVLQDGRDHPVSKRQVYGAIRLANDRLLEKRQRYLSVVRNIGYRVTRANEAVLHAKHRERKAQNQIGTALHLLKNTMMSEMNELERRVHETYQIGLNGAYTAIRQLNDKVTSTDRQVQSLQEEQHATEDAMQEFMKQMIGRIERLEQQRGDG